VLATRVVLSYKHCCCVAVTSWRAARPRRRTGAKPAETKPADAKPGAAASPSGTIVTGRTSCGQPAVAASPSPGATGSENPMPFKAPLRRPAHRRRSDLHYAGFHNDVQKAIAEEYKAKGDRMCRSR